MDEKKKLEDEGQEAPKQGSGSLLAAARKEQKKTVEEIANELNLSVTQIRTIELDQSEGLPEPTYVRGYIRSYARLLGLDVDDVLDHYLNPNWQKGSRLDDIPRGIGSASDNESSGFFTPAKVVFLIVATALIGFLWFAGKLDNILGSESDPIVEPAFVETDSFEAQPLVDSQTDSEQGNQPDQLEPESDSASTIQDESSENLLRLEFSDVSWVDIRDGEGNRLAFKNYVKGEDLSVTASTAMEVFLGNAEAVIATFNGEPYEIIKPDEAVFARFIVGE